MNEFPPGRDTNKIAVNKPDMQNALRICDIQTVAT